MPRTFTAPQRALLKAQGYNLFVKAQVENAAGAYVDFGTLSGIDWFDSAQWKDSIDSPTMEGSITFQREVGALSLAPLMTGSALNSGAPALDGARGVIISTAFMAPGTTPSGGDWIEVFRGLIDKPDWGGNEGVIVCTMRDIGGWLMAKWTQPNVTYSTDVGLPYETVMQAILDANVNPRLGAVTLYTPVSPGTNLRTFTLESKPTLLALRDIAAQIGWDVKFRYDAAGVFRLTFFLPDRAKTTPDSTFGPDEYFDIQSLELPTDDVRNIIDVSFQDAATGDILHSVQTDSASVAKYGPRYMQVAEGASSNIDTMGEADAMATAILSDLRLPYATQVVRSSFNWICQTGDLYGFLPNAVTNDIQIDLAVMDVTHSLANGDGDTTLTCRAQVAGAYKQWLLHAGDGIGALPIDASQIRLDDFKEIARDDVRITYGWTASPLVSEIWIYQKVLDQPTTVPPWPNATDLPLYRYDATLTSFAIDYPPRGKVTYTFFQPRSSAGISGTPKRVTTTSNGEPPHFEDPTQEVGASGLFATFAVNLFDAQKLGGVLRAWTNQFSPFNADPSGAEDGYYIVSATPQTLDGSITFTTPLGGAHLLNNIPVHAGRGKRIYLEFTNTLGISSGIQSFSLLSEGGILDETGQLLPGSILNALQFAVGVQPVQVYPTVGSFPAAADGTFAYATATNKIYKRIAGVWDASVDGGDIVSSSITAGKIAAGAITATAIAAGAVQATHIAVSSLGAINSNLGIIVSGVLNSLSGMVTIDLNATGTNAILSSPGLRLNADGSADFGGTVSASSFTASGATFKNHITIGGLAASFPTTLRFSDVFSLANINIVCTISSMPYTSSNGMGISISNTTYITTLVASAMYLGSAGPFSLGAADSGGTGYRVVLTPN